MYFIEGIVLSVVHDLDLNVLFGEISAYRMYN